MTTDTESDGIDVLERVNRAPERSAQTASHGTCRMAPATDQGQS